jgi:fructokinase
MSLRFGIDLGGTKIELLALDGAGREAYRKRVPSPSHDYDAMVRAIADLIAGAERDLDTRGSIGVGIPGALSPVTGLVKNANSTQLIGKPFKQDLERLLGREVRMMNDANCFALSEAVDGAAAGAAVVFGVILGTGVGGGVVVRGEVLTGPNAIAGEWGHNPLPLPNPEDLPLRTCYCRRSGCIEAYLSGPSFARDHERVTGEKLSPAEIVAGGNEATLARYEERLARALGGIINVIDPDVVVLGGGMSNVQRLYDNVPKIWGRYIFSDHVATRLVRAIHGDSSGVRGAAWLWGGPPK